MAKKKRAISAARRAQLRRQARINFGLNRKSYSTRRGARNVARRKSTRSRTKRYFSGGVKPMQVLVGGGIYGAVRAKISNALAPITSQVPLGTVADEAALFALGYFAHKKIKNPTVKSVAMAAMAVESARMGEALASGMAFSSSGAGTNGGGTFQTLA